MSWSIPDLHRPVQQYTSKQDSTLNYLNSQFDSSGGYLLPTLPPGSSMDENNKLMKESEGKPWVQILYHKSFDTNMGVNMAKNLVTNFIMVLLLCWIIAGYSSNTFGKTFLRQFLLA